MAQAAESPFPDLELSEADKAALRHVEPEPVAVEPEPEPVVQPEPVSHETPDNKAAAKPRDEVGRFAKPKEGEAEAPVKAPQVVPLATLLEERRAYQQKLDERDKTLTEGNKRLELLLNRFAKPAEEPKRPTIEDAPLDVLRSLQNEVQQLRGNQDQQTQLQQLSAHVAAQADQFLQKQPDYLDALGYARQARAAELRALGHPEQNIPSLVAQDELGISLQAIQQGRNPAELVYAYAGIRGYQPKAVPVVEPPQTQPDRLALQQKGIEASKSLSNAGGGPSPKMSLQTLVDMDETELMNLPEAQLQRILRGG